MIMGEEKPDKGGNLNTGETAKIASWIKAIQISCRENRFLADLVMKQELIMMGR